ncbi:DUF4400 domain-containing protein [Paraburkholderia mimosarum]|uniref:DUF4400 domain-containing protein n=1 Tax=Paraburkholderia mimosarum TaxID=312026 RepID=UPI0020D16CE0|nr:DUF4400 domain-containing protein [Paraburkholderia mimosarum]
MLPLLAAVVLPVVPDRALFEISDLESQSVVDTLGDARAGEAVDSTNVLFRRWFVDSGAVRATMSARSHDDLDADGMGGFARDWARQFWMLVYRALYRALVMHAWLAGILVLGMAAAIDGAVRRKIRAAAAGMASPLSFHLAMHALLMLLGSAFVVLLLPVPLIAQCWTLLAVLLPLLIWIVNSSA